MPSLTASAAPSADLHRSRRHVDEPRTPPVAARNDQPHQAEPVAPDAASTRLILAPLHQYLALQPVILDDTRLTIGSAADCHFRIPAKGVAERHAMILAGRHRVVLTAWDERTWLNDFPVREAVLRPGDRLAFGPVELIVRQAPPSEIAQHSSIERSDVTTADRKLPSRREQTTANSVSAPAVLKHHETVSSANRTRTTTSRERPAPSKEPDPGARAIEVCDAVQQAITREVLSDSRRSSTTVRTSTRLAAAEARHAPPAPNPSRDRDLAPRDPTGPQKAHSHEIDTWRIQLLEQEWSARSDKLSAREQELARVSAELESRQQEWNRARIANEKGWDSKQADLERLADQLAQERSRLAGCSADHDRRSAELEARELRLREEAVSLEKTARTLDDRDKLLRDTQTGLDRALQELARRIESVEQQEQLVAQRRTELDQRSRQLDSLDRELNDRQQKLDTKSAQQQSDVQRQLRNLAEEQERISEATAILDRERSAVEARAAELEQGERQSDQRREDLSRQEAELGERRQSMDAELQRLRQELDQQRTSIGSESQQLAERAADLDRRAAELETIVEQIGEREQALQSSLEMFGQRLAEVREERSTATGERQLLDRQAQELIQRGEQLAEQRQTLEQRTRELEQDREKWNAEAAVLHGELESGRNRLADERQSLQNRRTELEQMQWQLDSREQRLREREGIAAGSAQAIEVRREDLNALVSQWEQKQSHLTEQSAQLAEREQRLNQREREFHLRHDEWQVTLDTERQAVAARAAELSKSQQELESRSRTVSAREQKLQEREDSLQSQIEAERRTLIRERQELDQHRQAVSNEREQALQDHAAVQRQAEELLQRQQQWQVQDAALRERQRQADDRKHQLDCDLESLRAEQTLVEEEWRQLKAAQTELETERTQLRSEREQLDAELAHLQADRSQLTTEREDFDRHVRAGSAHEQTVESIETHRADELPLATDSPATDNDPESGNQHVSASAQPGENGWSLDDFLELRNASSTNESPQAEQPWDSSSDSALSHTQRSEEAAFDLDRPLPDTETPSSSRTDAEAPHGASLQSYVQDLLVRLRHDKANQPAEETSSESPGEIEKPSDADRQSPALDVGSASDAEEQILASVSELGQAVHEAVARDAKSRPATTESRAELDSLRELANYSARSAIAQHTWKKTKSELAMKASFVAGALAMSAGMDSFLASSPKYSKLSILPLGLALFVAGDLALSYFRARRVISQAEESADTEAWQEDGSPAKARNAAGAPVPASQYVFEYADEQAQPTTAGQGHG